jgi:AAA+ superfamily predicted ATPase
MLDSALFRRFDDVIEFQMPNSKCRRDAFANGLAALSPSEAILSAISKESNGLSFGEIMRVCDDSLKEAVLTRSGDLSLDLLRRSLKDRCLNIARHEKAVGTNSRMLAGLSSSRRK